MGKRNTLYDILIGACMHLVHPYYDMTQYVCVCIIYHYDFLQKKQVFVDLNELSEEIQGVLMNHLSMFSIGSTSGVERIDQHVK